MSSKHIALATLHRIGGRRAWPLVIFALSALLAGCGGGAAEQPPRAAVSGNVVLDGEPLTSGSIRFVPADETEGPQTTATIDNGHFVLPEIAGPIVGWHRVEIVSSDTGGLAMDDEEALLRLQNKRPRTPIKVVQVPARYNTNSELSTHVSDLYPNELTFDLVSKGK